MRSLVRTLLLCLCAFQVAVAHADPASGSLAERPVDRGAPAVEVSDNPGGGNHGWFRDWVNKHKEALQVVTGCNLASTALTYGLITLPTGIGGVIGLAGAALAVFFCVV